MTRKHLRILSVDDDSDYQAAAAIFLAMNGKHMLFSAMTGKAGLEKATEVKPDVILLDLQLPDMSGAEVIRKLRATPVTRGIPVIIVTGSVLSSKDRMSIKKNPNLLSIEEKPIPLKELLAKIEAELLGQPGFGDHTGLEAA